MKTVYLKNGTPYKIEYSIVKIGRSGTKSHVGIASSSIRESDFGKMNQPNAICESGGFSWRNIFVVTNKGIHNITCEKCQKSFGKIVNLDELNRE